MANNGPNFFTDKLTEGEKLIIKVEMNIVLLTYLLIELSDE